MSHHHRLSDCLNNDYMRLRDDIFTAIPQEPHFKPLEELCQGVQQGLKVGLDLVFVNLVQTFGNVDKLLQLSADDVQEITSQLSQLEDMGYECSRLRERFHTERRILEEERVARMKIEEVTLEKRDKKEKESLTQTRIAEMISELNKLEATSKNLEEQIQVLKAEEMSYAEERVKILQEWTSAATASWHH